MGLKKRRCPTPALVAAGLAVSFSYCANAEVIWDFSPLTYDTSDPATLHFNGTIEPQAMLQLEPALRRFPNVTTIALSSLGGDISTALSMAYFIREAGLQTEIPKGTQCHSACSILYFAGVSRFAEGELGVHQYATTISSSKDSQFLVQVALKKTIEAYSDFSVPNDVLLELLDAAPNEMYVFPTERLVALGLTRTERTVAEGYSETALSPSIPDICRQHDDIKIGILQAFTGPLESLIPPIALGAELAISEVAGSGIFLGGANVEAVRADSTCVNSVAAVASAERLVTDEGVKGIIGPTCSGATMAVLQNVSLPNEMVTISPTATSPELSAFEDNGLFFRTAPSDARQGEIMADMLLEKGLASAAVTYTNNEYGAGLANSFAEAFQARGGRITIRAPHLDGAPDYGALVKSLAEAGGDILVVAGYVDQGGSSVVRAALDGRHFSTFMFPDGMVASRLEEQFGEEIEGSIGQLPSQAPGFYRFANAVNDRFDATSVYADSSYDSAAIMLLAMQAAQSSDPRAYKRRIVDVANAPGEKVYAGQLAKGLELLAAGKDIDYVGATSLELIGSGESAGFYREVAIVDGKLTTVGYR